MKLLKSLNHSPRISYYLLISLKRRFGGIRRLLRTTRRKVLAISLILIIILSPIAYLQLFGPKEVEAGWFDDAYNYRNKITFGNTGAADSNKKVKFDIDTATLITAGKMQSNCGDSRFTDANGKVLRYFLDSAGGACNTASTDYWVLVPTINSGDTVLYHYYGSPSAPNGTEGSQFTEATFSPTSGPTTASEEKGPSPQMYLKFDEGVDNTCSGGTNDACDQTSFANSGAISNGTAWKTEDLCLSGKCLFFDGTDDIVTVTNASSIDLNDQLAGAFTFQAWIRPNGAGEGTGGQIFYKGTNTWLRVDTLSNGKLDIEASLDLATTDATLNVSQAVDDNRWTHVVVSYTDDADDEITIYVNGNNAGSSTNGVGSPAADTNNLLIGGTTTNNFKGFIDEFKIYKEERTAAQIKTDFVKGTSSLHGVQAAYGIRDYSGLSDGLVGYWKMDETSGNRADSSGNGNTLTDNNTVTSNPGKFGNAGQFTAANSEYLSLADNATLSTGDIDFAVTAWVYLDSKTLELAMVTKYDNDSGPREYYLGYEGSAVDRLEFEVYASDNSVVGSAKANTLGSPSTGTWYFVVGWHDSVNNQVGISINGGSADVVSASGVPFDSSAGFKIGGRNSIPSEFHNGRLEEVRLYKRVLSEKDRGALYNWAPGPVGYWPMDENTGTSTVNDRSGNGNNGTMNGSMTESDWVPGKFGSALDFDGSDDNINVSDNATLRFSGDFSTSLWIKTSSSSNMAFVTKRPSSGLAGWYFGTQATNTFLFYCAGCTTQSTNSSTITFRDNLWHHIAVTRSGSTITFYLDGVTQGTGSNVNANFSNTDNLEFGKDENVSDKFSGVMDEVRLYNYTRTAGQIIEDMNAGHPAPGSPVGSALGHWKFDEGYGDTANDSGTGGNNGNLAGGTVCPQSGDSACPTWTNFGKFGKALDFEDSGTSDDYVEITDTADLDITGELTISSWVNAESLASADNVGLVAKYRSQTGQTDQRAYDLFLNENTDVVGFAISSDGTFANTTVIETSSTISTGSWYHLVAVYKPSTYMRIYINGVLVKEQTTSIPSAIFNSPAPLWMGLQFDSTNADLYFDGVLDEVKIYNLALTADQVKLDMNQGKAAVWGATGTDSSGNATFSSQNEYCPPGQGSTCTSPVGEWKMDEKTGQSANDTSGNGNTGTLGSSGGSDTADPTWSHAGECKKGACLNFDGTDDYVSVSDSSSLDIPSSFTVSSWVNLSASQNGYVLEKGTTGTANYYLIYHFSPSRFRCGFFGGAAFRDHDYNFTPTLGRWYHVSCVFDDTGNTVKIYVDGVEGSSTAQTNSPDTNASALWLGRSSVNNVETIAGKLDDMRIYNYARTPAQIAWDFNRGGPVGWWKFDECSGTVANDSSGKVNNGTITIGATGSNTSAGTCSSGIGTQAWNNGTIGKRNYSLDFDGTDDYVDLTSTIQFDSGNFTIAGWFKTSATGAFRQIWNSGYNGGNLDTEVLVYSNNILTFFVRDSTGGGGLSVNSATTVTDNLWHSFAAVRNGNTFNLYLDGISSGTGTMALGDLDVAGVVPRIGNGLNNINNRFFDGQIDEVKIYNYALTAQQIRDVYNSGAVRYGPLEGSP